MKTLIRSLLYALGFLCVFSSSLSAEQISLYLQRWDGLQLEKKQDHLGVLVHFKVLLALLKKIEKTDPTWEHALVSKDIADSRDRITALQPLAEKQLLDKGKSPLTSGQPISIMYSNGLKETDERKALNELEEYRTTLEI